MFGRRLRQHRPGERARRGGRGRERSRCEFLGEVGLAGEIRKVSGVSRRLAEAHRLGFKRALVPTGSDVKIDGMEIVEVSRLDQALQRVKISGE